MRSQTCFPRRCDGGSKRKPQAYVPYLNDISLTNACALDLPVVDVHAVKGIQVGDGEGPVRLPLDFRMVARHRRILKLDVVIRVPPDEQQVPSQLEMF
jgi:hypothetical protein